MSQARRPETTPSPRPQVAVNTPRSRSLPVGLTEKNTPDTAPSIMRWTTTAIAIGVSSAPLPHGFNVLVVPIKFVSAREMAKLLEPFAADNTVRVDEVRNLVIMAGSQRELRHLLDTIELFDVDWLSGYSVGLFPIKSADVKGLVQDLDRVFGAGAQSPLAGVVRVLPIERLNALLGLVAPGLEHCDVVSGVSQLPSQ